MSENLRLVFLYTGGYDHVCSHLMVPAGVDVEAELLTYKGLDWRDRLKLGVSFPEWLLKRHADARWPTDEDLLEVNYA